MCTAILQTFHSGVYTYIHFIEVNNQGLCVYVSVFYIILDRRQMNSQQQQWGSEEDKVDSAIPNTYTTLALNPGNSELPPSPSTPLVCSFFSTEVDPKWEFPRENIQLKDVLHEGQFTILYKGTVKGIKERMVEVAVKSVRGTIICDIYTYENVGSFVQTEK